MSKTANFLAADLGASNGRVLLGRWDGERFQLEVLHRFENGPTNVLGRLYWDVLALWREVKTGMLRYAAANAEPLAGIGIDTWGVDYGLLDAAGRLLGNPVHYRDSRTQGMVDHLFTRIPKREVFDLTGIQFLELNTLFQLYSMRVQGDPQLDAAQRLLLMPDLFHYWLSGEQVAEYTIASTTQMLLARERSWATEMLARLDLPAAILPPIVQPGTVIGPLLTQVAEETGVPAGAPVVASAAHDTGSAVAAIPGLDAHSVYLSSGTWSLMGIEVRQPIINTQMLDLNFTNEGGVDGTIRLLKNISGLWLLQESRRQWEREGRAYTWEALMMEAQQATPFRSIINSDAPDFNTPHAMVDAIRAFCRRTHQPEPQTPGEVVRCCLESLALRYRWVVEALEEILVSAGLSRGRQLDTIRVVGGGSQNRLLNQFTADACGRTVITGPVEAAALGVIMMQAVATGHLANVAEGRAAIAASIEQEVFTPRATAGWDDAYARFLRLIE
ncbi:MAG TPA: rhamnulokinase [Chloroflexi bacterium]|nr:rhamnulokinase [Chloroflexota bacterium]HHW88257.1 rhamnulokinase [Chloroflexota bacterium]